MKNRVIEYDILRVLATITVVIGHCAYLEWGGDNGFISCVSETYSSVILSIPIRLLQFLSTWVYSFHMPLFFMLSGACYNEVGGAKHYGNSIDKLVVNKFRTLLVPLLLSGILYMIPLKRLVGFYNNATAFQSVQFLLRGTEADGHLWFLYALFWIFVVFFLLERYVGKSSVFLCLLSTIIIEFIFNSLNSKGYVSNRYCFVQAMQYLKYFGIGYYFNERREKFLKFDSRVLCVLCMLLSVLNYFYNFMGTFSSALIGSAGFLYFAVMISHSNSVVESKIYKKLLVSSFYIYLFHDPLNFVWIKLAQKMRMLQMAWGVIVFYFLRTIGNIIISIGLYLVVSVLLKQIQEYFGKSVKGTL